MTLNSEQKNNAKEKAARYLESSIYTLSALLGVDPEDAMQATSVDDLSAGLSGLDAAVQQSFESLFSQVQSLKKIS
jgi:hypothetical protein